MFMFCEHTEFPMPSYSVSLLTTIKCSNAYVFCVIPMLFYLPQKDASNKICSFFLNLWPHKIWW